ISAEHILPQNPKHDSQWEKDFSDKERIDLTDKIGNLVLISRRKNSSQGQSDFELKKKKYFENNIELFRNSVRVLTNNSKWSPIELNANHVNVIAKIENHYRK
ncbi:unnamed protein product, partial [marine sediment metagenome]